MKMLVTIANREDPDQTASSEESFFRSSLIWVYTVCLGLFWQTTIVRSFRTFTVYIVAMQAFNYYFFDFKNRPKVKVIYIGTFETIQSNEIQENIDKLEQKSMVHHRKYPLFDL